ncbi:MAG: glycosyltransferase family 4 protein [Geitlerinemataceae cyanobacterium]
MRITFVLPTVSLRGGIRSTATLANRLQKRGHSVFAVSVPRRPPSLRDRVRTLLGRNKFVPPSSNSHFDYIDVPLHTLARRRPVEDRDVPDADIVVATWWETAEWVARLSAAKGIKTYFIRHHEIHDSQPIDRVMATYSLPMHKITTAQWMVDLMSNRYGDNCVSVVPNSVDTQLFYAPPRGKQPVPTVGMMYAKESWKGCDISLKAFSLAAQNIPGLRLIVFGMKDPVPELPLPPGTEYICQPPQETIRDIYSQCDAWLFGSRIEGFGLPILEAMACRTPVIGTPAGAAPDFLADGAGILVRPEDPEDMARAIEQICHFSNLEWQAMSDRAYETIISYTWDDAAKLCEEAFITAIDRWRRGDFKTH